MTVTDENSPENIQLISVTPPRCCACGKPFAHLQPTWITHDLVYKPTRPTCETCKDSQYPRDFGNGAPCLVCRRLVYRFATRKIPKWNFCSDACSSKGWAAERRRKRLEKQGTYSCEGCSTAFRPTRADARFCSPACKQKSYRQRVTGVNCRQNIHGGAA
jgi:hypothetical protein